MDAIHVSIKAILKDRRTSRPTRMMDVEDANAWECQSKPFSFLAIFSLSSIRDVDKQPKDSIRSHCLATYFVWWPSFALRRGFQTHVLTFSFAPLPLSSLSRKGGPAGTEGFIMKSPCTVYLPRSYSRKSPYPPDASLILPGRRRVSNSLVFVHESIRERAYETRL